MNKNELKSIVEDLKRELMELDFNLDLYYDGSDISSRELFVDCKMNQQNSLDYANDILRTIKKLEN